MLLLGRLKSASRFPLPVAHTKYPLISDASAILDLDCTSSHRDLIAGDNSMKSGSRSMPITDLNITWYVHCMAVLPCNKAECQPY